MSRHTNRNADQDANQETIRRVRKAFESMNVYPGAKSLKDDEDLFACGALDSLVMIQFVLALEDEFGERLANEAIAYENFSTLRAVAALMSGQAA